MIKITLELAGFAQAVAGWQNSRILVESVLVTDNLLHLEHLCVRFS